MFEALEDEYKLEVPESKDELTEEEKNTSTGRRLSRKLTLGQVMFLSIHFFRYHIFPFCLVPIVFVCKYSSVLFFVNNLVQNTFGNFHYVFFPDQSHAFLQLNQQIKIIKKEKKN